MSRGLTPTIEAEFAKKNLVPLLFVEVQFVSGWVRLWSGIGAIVWNGQTWLGVALPNGTVLGSISQLQETTDGSAQAAALSLSGIPSTAVQQVLNECRPNNIANIFLGAADQVTGAVLADPYCAWSGYTDVPTISDSGDTCTVTISVESRLVDLQRAREWRYTNEDQQLFVPGDIGFEYVGALQSLSITWGKGAPVFPPVPPGQRVAKR
ncbi:hypothetical protein Acid345_3158 [Candidatus Koribacter versatilis Ellin345]|uniref:Uncharacterized protein n=1 Tax=Koribacter versatilis (strain Ellin345) TaxID=204669 RepID=Q1ILU1_KORVE|nr:hypothetical protein [Candidatus Koribacter versatilis]ABF42159.1 hypothetical protein Acid345_3158 [Candidatus Koribacter versatilis Ellin345]